MSSERDLISAREFREFVREEDRKTREQQDRIEYDKYVAELESQQRRCAPAQRVEPLTFDQWRTQIPEEFKNAPPDLRGAAATNKALTTTFTRTVHDLVRAEVESGQIEDKHLLELGFDIRHRPNTNVEIEFTPHSLGALFEKVRQRDSRFVPSLHLQPVCEFLVRNRLMFGGDHAYRAFGTLLHFGIIQPAQEPAPEPRPEGVNENGVNLRVEPDPNVERERRRRDYFEKVVVTHEGVNYTQAALDRLSSTEFRKVMALYGNRAPKFSHVMQPDTQ